MWHVLEHVLIWKTKSIETIAINQTPIIAVPNFKSMQNITESFGPLMMYQFILAFLKTAIK
jgi:hypothetical protein